MTRINISDQNTVLITGSAKRIGRNLANALAQRGYAVILHYNQSRQDAENLAAEISAKGGKAVPIAGDLSNANGAANLFAAAQKPFGPIGVLINNAALFARDTWQDIDENKLQDHLQINTIAPILLMHHMYTQKIASGCIINILDHNILKFPRGYTSYTISKSALWAATQSAAAQFAPKLRVNAIAPGIILPPSGQEPEQNWRDDYAQSPLPHIESIDDIISACLHLVENPMANGQLIPIDSGRHLSPEPILRKKQSS